MKRAVFLFALFANLFSARTASAGDTIRLPIMDREGVALVQREADLKDLISSSSFEGKIFRVVDGSSSVPICLFAKAAGCTEASDIIRLRAATAYYHMVKAREWFLTQPAFQVEPYLASLNEKVTIRVNIDVPWDSLLHFDPSGNHWYNGARTIGPSRDWEKDDDTEAWGPETWFFTPKKKTNTSAGDMLGRMVSSPDFKDPLRDSLLYSDFLDLSRDAMDGQIDPVTHLIAVLFSLGTVELVPSAIGVLGKLMKQSQLMDAALIPEVSYHEYTHTVLAPVFGTLKSSAVNEGYGNYFAHQISGLSNIGDHVKKKVSRGYSPKHEKSKNRYTIREDISTNAARQGFTYSVLMDLEKSLGADGFQIITRALNFMDSSTRLKSEKEGLEERLVWAIREITPAGTKQDGQILAIRTALRIRSL